MIRRTIVMAVLIVICGSSSLFGQAKRKIILDQDARGPATTDQQSMLALIQAPQVDVLGITIVSGDMWRDEEVAHTLRMLELTGHPNIKVYPGAIFPLINSKEEIARWEKLYGVVRYQGAWKKYNTGGKFARDPHGPYEVPDLVEGNPTLKAETEDAAHFIIRMVHQYPHEVTIYAGGPLTNLAVALSLDPKVAELAQELVIMGGSIGPDVDIDWKTENRREFNFWFDPESVHMTLRAPWKKITVTTVDISVKTRLTNDMIQKIASAGTPSALYIGKYADEEYLWDELAAVAWLDPSVITKEVVLYMDMDISHTAGYGNTLVWSEADHPGLGEQKVHVQLELDKDKFYKKLMALLAGKTEN